MYKKIGSLVSLFLLNVSLVFGAPFSIPNDMPPRPDHLDATSPQAKMQLQRANQLLTTLIPDVQDYQLVLSDNPTFGAEAFPAHVFSEKPTIIVYQGSLSNNHANEELAFMLAHELGHVRLRHSDQMDKIMDHFYEGSPLAYIGIPLTIYFQKLQEQEADMFGLYLYKKAGYNTQFFPYQLNALKRAEFYPSMAPPGMDGPPGSLSMKDPHYSMKDRFAHLVQRSHDSPEQIAYELGIAPATKRV